MQEKSENNNVKIQQLVYHGDAGLSILLGTKNKVELRRKRDFVFVYKGRRFPKFPRHIDISKLKTVYWYLRTEVQDWLEKFAILCDDMEQYGEPKNSLKYFEHL